MSPKTKGRVKYGRKIQLGLRVLALLGAIGSLFCAVVIKGAAAIIWIIRVGVSILAASRYNHANIYKPIVAVLHTLYGIFHLCRSPVTRPPGSQASYMVFAATVDLGLIPFYIFSAYIAEGQYTDGSYNWETLLGTGDVTQKIAQTIFLLSIINGGLHAVSFGISVSLAVIFRQIGQLPPDLNPLEDNLTSRPHKRNKSELTEKYLSQGSMDSGIGMDDPLIGPPRNVPFMHTRERSSDDGQVYSDNPRNNPLPPLPPQHDHIPHVEPTRPEVRFRQLACQPNVQISPMPAQNLDNVLARPTSAIIQNDPDWDTSPPVPERSQCISPVSDNWVIYPSRSPSPAPDVPAHMGKPSSPVEDTQINRPPSRGASSVFTRSNTTASTGSGFRNWLNYSQRYGSPVDGVIAEENRGQYESLATNEYYGNDDDMRASPQQTPFYDNTNAEQDLGDHRINIHLDQEDAEEDLSPARQNPLGMNPPTPQPIEESQSNANTNTGRSVLSDIPNLTPNPPARNQNQQKGNRFYNDLEEKTGLSVNRTPSGKGPKKERSKLVKRDSQKAKAYSSLKQHDDEIDGPVDPVITEGDRKGRVVSNSGADIAAQRSLGSGSSLSYGNYIAGLGVGRRRDVSGKIAEEGRVGSMPEEKKTPSQNTTPRAAGWARFAGL